jgi:hypothetical protein
MDEGYELQDFVLGIVFLFLYLYLYFIFLYFILL